MLNDAAISAKPTKYTQNKRHGMYGGTAFIRIFPPERCSAPKAANGIAKHKLVRATILLGPRAFAISFFAANRPITSSASPAPDIETAGRENSKNAARIVGGRDLLKLVQRVKFYDDVGFQGCTPPSINWRRCRNHSDYTPSKILS